MAKLPIAGQRLRAPAKAERAVSEAVKASDSTTSGSTTQAGDTGSAGDKPGVSDAAAAGGAGGPSLSGPVKAPGAGKGEGGGSGGGVGGGSGGETDGAGGGTPRAAEATGGLGVINDALSQAGRSAAVVEEKGRETRTAAEVVDDAVAEARATNPATAAREAARTIDTSRNENRTTGIAEQGTGAISADPDAVRAGLLSEAERLFQAELDTIAKDKAFQDFTDRTLGNMKLVDELGPDAVETAGGAKLVEKVGDATVTTIKHRDGTTVVKTDADGDGKVDSTTVTQSDGSSTRASGQSQGSGAVTDNDGKGNSTTTPVGNDSLLTPAPDTEGTGSGEFRFISQGLKDRLGPRTGGDGGDIDPVEDDGVGSVVGASGPIPQTGGLLTGGDGRAGDVREGPATSGFNGLDPGGNAGVIDPVDDAADPFGGGLEDDPLAGSGPSVGLDGVSGGGLGVGDDADDGDDADGFSISESTLFRPVSVGSISGLSSVVDSADDDTDENDPNA